MNPVLHIQVDSREKRPLIFPKTLDVLSNSHPATTPHTRTIRITTQITTLQTGDYSCLEGCVVIERKGSIGEVAQNLLTPQGRRRFLAECGRLTYFPNEPQKLIRPYLLLEGTPQTILQPTPNNPRPFHALDSLTRLLVEHDISLLLLKTDTPRDRLLAGEVIARILLAGTLLPPRPCSTLNPVTAVSESSSDGPAMGPPVATPSSRDPQTQAS